MAFSLKDYQIVEEIGRGGFASVYRARQKSLGKEVAIKCLAPKRLQNSAEIVRFRREAEAMAALTHDNIVGVFDYAFQDGNFYIVMEYVEGMAFSDALERSAPRDCSLFILEKVAEALRYAHGEKIIHRDIKPANILLGRNGQVKLADFGLAMFSSNIEFHTAPGSVLGTISYMAPEALASPGDVDARIDVFALGCILYRVLAGKLPFEGSSFGDISYRILNSEPPPPDTSRLPGTLAEMTMGCLRKDREKRPSIKEIHDCLQSVIKDRYHALHEELISFVRSGACDDTDLTIPAMPPQKVEVPPLRRWRPLPLSIAASGAFVLIVGMLFFFHPWRGGNPARIVALPELPGLSAGGPSETSMNELPEGKPGKVSKDAPHPLSGSALDMKVGMLVFRGILPQDTVLLNGTKVSILRKGKEARIEVVPGYYKLAIRRNGALLMARDIELVPYQRLTIEAKSERIANGRDSS
jgi:serine/threonine protein kinase